MALWPWVLVPQIKALSPSKGWTAGSHYTPDILQGCTRTPWYRKSRQCLRARGGRQAVRLSSLSARISSTGCRWSSGPFQSGASSSPHTPSGSRPRPGIGRPIVWPWCHGPIIKKEGHSHFLSLELALSLPSRKHNHNGYLPGGYKEI
jgi:hypothetical protein